mgnify:CR=1 FL=1
MHRLFAALPVPAVLADRLDPLNVEIHGARWRKRHHYHVTLCFYGTVDGEVANELADALEQIKSPAIDLELAGVGWFGRREPRALYARIAANDSLAQLASDCRKLARRFDVKLGQDPFLPHITVAYCNQYQLEADRTRREGFQVMKSEPVHDASNLLYQSFAGQGRQSQYVPQADYQLAGPS